MTENIWIEEFLFRGRPSIGPGSESSAAYHVVLHKRTVSAFDDTKFTDEVMMLTPDKAESAGWSLATILNGINAEAVSEVSVLRARVLELEAQVNSLTESVQPEE